MSNFGTCEIADGMAICGYNGGELPYVVQRSGDTEDIIYGRAYTVEFAPLSDPRPAVSDHYIDSVPADSILVIATSKSCHLPYAPYTTITQSLYGGLMSQRAIMLRAKGTVVLGSIRDLPEQRRLKYPVFSYSVGTTAGNNVAKVVGVNTPLDTGFGTIVHPGDHVFADPNGVVVVPADAYHEVLGKTVLRARANEMTESDIEIGKNVKQSQAYWRGRYA